MPKLYIMVGLSGSGKSSIANKIAQSEDAVIVSSDAIRSEISFYEDQTNNNQVFQLFHKRIKDNLLKGNNVIADATNITIKSRRSIIKNVKNINCNIVAYVVAKRFYDCFIDNEKREHPVPESVLRRQIKHFQIPFSEEGIDEIIIDKCNYDIFPISEVAYWSRNFDQKSKWHHYTLDEHCYRVACKFVNKYPQLDLAALYHDCGKPFCQTFDDEQQAHYFCHANIGAYILMTYSYTATLDDIFLINYHMFPFDWNTSKTHRKYKILFGKEKYDMLLYFNFCDKTES